VTRTIFSKIFLWFWFAMATVTVSVLLITVIGGAQPLARRWLARSLDLYAASAVDFYQQGGEARLEHYLDRIRDSSGIEAALIDPQGRDILGRGLPAGTERVFEQARRAGESRFHTWLRWTGASVIHTPQGDFYLVARVPPLRGFWSGQGLVPLLLRVTAALVSAALLCWLIARHLTAPVRTLQEAARRIAGGDLTVRAAPGIPPRNDELADLALDFDRMADRIQELLRKQQELLGHISHELRSPLARLEVSLELARRGDGEALERMQTDLDRLDAMIGQILTLTRAQLQEGQAAESTVNLRAMVESIAQDASFEGSGEQKSVVILQAADCGMRGDAALLRSCLENVVRNALRYTHPGTAVEVSLVRTEGIPPAAVFTVKDHGPGVSPEALPRLFEAFYRASDSRERWSGGSGLGLAIAHKVVSLYGGSIAARNRNGGGLEVEVVLPLAAAPQMGTAIGKRSL
jgi:two-component system sensor histidine kinase CpxA